MSHPSFPIPLPSSPSPSHLKSCYIGANTNNSINAYGTVSKRSTTTPSEHAHTELPRDTCIDPFLSPLATRDIANYAHTHAGHHRRQSTSTTLTQGYTTSDAFGTDGDDTAHTAIASYKYPKFFQALGNFPANGSVLPDVVDLIFIDYIATDMLEYFATLSDVSYTEADIVYYINENFSTQTYLPQFVQQSPLFQQNLDNCTIYEI